MNPTPSPTAAPAPREFTDDLGRRVEIKGTPRRIVALSPALVEALFAAGVTPVGRTSNANYPAAAKQVTDVGLAQNLSYEGIAELKPDLIVASASFHGSELKKLEDLGAPVMLFGISCYSDVLKSTKVIGQVTNREAEAEKVTKPIENRVATIRARIPAEKPTVFILVGNGKAFYGALPSSYVGSLINEIGATNVVSGTEDARYRGFTSYNMNTLAERDPDVIIIIHPTANVQRTPSVSPEFQADARWQNLKAVKAKRVKEISPFLFVQNPGLRVEEALSDLAAILYPDIFGKGN